MKLQCGKLLLLYSDFPMLLCLVKVKLKLVNILLDLNPFIIFFW